MTSGLQQSFLQMLDEYKAVIYKIAAVYAFPRNTKKTCFKK